MEPKFRTTAAFANILGSFSGAISRWLRRWWPVLAGLTFLSLCVWVTLWSASRSFRESMSYEIENVEVNISRNRLPPTLDVHVDLRLSNTREVPVMFESLDGTLSVGGREVEHRFTGLSQGEVIEGHTSRQIQLLMTPGSFDLLSIGLGTALSRELQVEYSGWLSVRLWGIKFTMPLSVEDEVLREMI